MVAIDDSAHSVRAFEWTLKHLVNKNNDTTLFLIHAVEHATLADWIYAEDRKEWMIKMVSFIL